jgi:ADP-ribose pyrophosphatase YjhB (NUDIX family)
MQIIDLSESKFNLDDVKNHHSIMALVRDEFNNILMLGHSKFRTDKFKAFTMPVGKVDDGDSIKGTLVKELREEIGISINKFTEVHVFENKIARDGKEVIVTMHCFVIDRFTGKAFNAEAHKHYSLGWHSAEQIQRDQANYIPPAIEFLKAIKLIK